MSIVVRDSNGTALADGDSVTLIKDLKVKGTSVTLKRGTLVKNIRLTDDPAEVECNAEKVKVSCCARSSSRRPDRRKTCRAQTMTSWPWALSAATALSRSEPRMKM